jgi:hypothetical protein
MQNTPPLPSAQLRSAPEVEQLLSTREVAEFAARGFLRFDGLVGAAQNEAFLHEFEAGFARPLPAGTPLAQCYAPGSGIARLLALPRIAGALHSLLGPGPIFDHHYFHVLDGRPSRPQPLHQDSTIDTRTAFDVQLFYYPQAVTEDMGGTRFLPGSHLRLVNEASIARYQNVLGQQHLVCPAGTVLLFHHGLWHGGGHNRSSKRRVLFKLRLQPSVPQHRHWDTGDLGPATLDPQPIFVPGVWDENDVQSILCSSEPWYEDDTQRLEFINRIQLWRYLLGDARADAHYWSTRVENEPSRAGQ